MGVILEERCVLVVTNIIGFFFLIININLLNYLVGFDSLAVFLFKMAIHSGC